MPSEWEPLILSLPKTGFAVLALPANVIGIEQLPSFYDRVLRGNPDVMVLLMPPGSNVSLMDERAAYELVGRAADLLSGEMLATLGLKRIIQ